MIVSRIVEITDKNGNKKRFIVFKDLKDEKEEV